MSEEKKTTKTTKTTPVPVAVTKEPAPVPTPEPKKTRKPRTTKPKVSARERELEAKLEQAAKVIQNLQDTNNQLEAHIRTLEQRYTAITNHIAQNIDLCRANILVAIKEG